jgi:hypothetical protein
MEYKNEKDLGPDSIQKWCEEMDKKPRSALTQEQAHIIVLSTINEESIAKDPKVEELYDEWNAIGLLYKRIKYCHTYTIEKAALIFLSCGIDSPGNSTQYANFLQYKCWQLGIKHIDMKALIGRILPGGFFTKETLDEMWEKQKYISDEKFPSLRNMLDNARFMESIRDIKVK